MSTKQGIDWGYINDPKGLSADLEKAYTEAPPEPMSNGLGERLRARRQALEQEAGAVGQQREGIEQQAPQPGNGDVPKMSEGLGDRIRERREGQAQAVDQGQQGKGGDSKGQDHSRWGWDNGSPINRTELPKDKGSRGIDM